MPTASSLRQRLAEFQAAVLPVDNELRLNHAVFRNAQLKSLSLALACVAWYALAFDPSRVQRTFAFPIVYRNVGKTLSINEGAPTECRVTLSGSDRDFRFLDPAAVIITLDLTDAKAGFQEIQLSEKNIRLPTNLSPYRIDPRTVRLRLQTVKEISP